MMGVPDVDLKPVDATDTAIAHGRNAVSEHATFRVLVERDLMLPFLQGGEPTSSQCRRRPTD
jgi:hypothetical protein